MNKQPKKPIYNKALDLLARQDYSISKITTKLLGSGYQAEEVAQTVEKLKDCNLLNEEEYAKKRIRTFIEKGHGIKLINMNLEKEQIQVSEYLVQDIYQSLQIDTHVQIQRLIEKKFRNIKLTSQISQEEVNKQKQKLLRYLISYGHDYELCQQLSHEYFSQDSNNA